MSDLLHDARQLRQKMFHLEVLLEIEKGGQKRGWFTGKTARSAERARAIKRLIETGLIEAAEPPKHYRLTSEGFEFLQDLRAKTGAGGPLDWTRADEIHFGKL